MVKDPKAAQVITSAIELYRKVGSDLKVKHTVSTGAVLSVIRDGVWVGGKRVREILAVSGSIVGCSYIFSQT